MTERVLVRKKNSGVIIGCSKDTAEEYVRSGMVEILPVSPLQNGYWMMMDNPRYSEPISPSWKPSFVSA